LATQRIIKLLRSTEKRIDREDESKIYQKLEKSPVNEYDDDDYYLRLEILIRCIPVGETNVTRLPEYIGTSF
jgi:hypothetical protein